LKIARYEFDAENVSEDKLIENIKRFARQRDQLYRSLYIQNIIFHTLIYEEFFRNAKSTEIAALELIRSMDKTFIVPSSSLKKMLDYSPPIKHKTAIKLLPSYSIACCRLDMLMKTHSYEVV
jgi:hypothetical protein